MCEDTDNGALSANNTGCDWFNENTEYCGFYTTESFNSLEMCCNCIGLTCQDRSDDATNSQGNGCSWYEEQGEFTGYYCVDSFSWYNTADFIAVDLCCACWAEGCNIYDDTYCTSDSSDAC